MGGAVVTCACGGHIQGRGPRCPVCAFMRQRERRFAGNRKVRRPGEQCREPGCTRLTVPGANGPMPSRCPWHWHGAYRARLERWRAVRRQGTEHKL